VRPDQLAAGAEAPNRNGTQGRPGAGFNGPLRCSRTSVEGNLPHSLVARVVAGLRRNLPFAACPYAARLSKGRPIGLTCTLYRPHERGGGNLGGDCHAFLSKRGRPHPL